MMRIAISCGDPNGIGLEVVLKTLAHAEVRSMAQFYLFCSPQVMAYHRKSLQVGDIPYTQVAPGDPLPSGRIGLIDPWNREVQVDFGQLTDESGQAALDSLAAACDAVEAGQVDALVTAPLSKANIPPSSEAPFYRPYGLPRSALPCQAPNGYGRRRHARGPRDGAHSTERGGPCSHPGAIDPKAGRL